jgi:hypothetical protein
MPDGLRAARAPLRNRMQMVAENGRHLFEAGQKIIVSISRTMSDGWAKEQLRDEALWLHVRRHLRGPFRWQARTTKGVRSNGATNSRRGNQEAGSDSRIVASAAEGLQAMVNTLPAEERGSVLAEPFRTD